MSGFFTKAQIPINNQINKATCSRCGLEHKCRTPKIQPSGKGDKGIYILLDAPSTADDIKGAHLSGESGKYLISVLRQLDINIFRDCIVDYAVKCRPPKGNVTALHIDACRSKLWDNLEQYKPKVVIILGTTGLEMFLKPRWKGVVGDINMWRGFIIPDRSVKAWVCPTFSNKFVLQQHSKHPVLDKIFIDDLRDAIQHWETPYPNYVEETSQIKIINDEESQIAWMSSLYEASLKNQIICALDYETTGIKPHAPGHEIACVSLAYKEDEAVSMWYPTLSIKSRRWLKKILTSKRILKVAHNMKYEISWTKNVAGYVLDPVAFCTMQAAHIIDNRPKITGLKFQTYVNFGLMGYEDVIKPFLESDGGGNSFNTVFKAPRMELQLYNGVDSLVQLRLMYEQLKETCYVIC